MAAIPKVMECCLSRPSGDGLDHELLAEEERAGGGDTAASKVVRLLEQAAVLGREPTEDEWVAAAQLRAELLRQQERPARRAREAG